MSLKKTYIILTLIFLINFLFKLIYIAGPSFWYDEIISAQDTLLDFGHIKHESEWDKNPPFYYYVLWIWSKIFGISEFALRSMSAFFSALTAVLIYRFSEKLFSKQVAIISTLVFTLHPFIYYFAQEARCFSLLIFIITLNLILLHHLLQTPSYLKAFLLGVLNFLIFYTHYLAGLILLCQFILLIFTFRRRWFHLILIYVTPILLVLLRFTRKQYNVLFFSQEMSKQKKNVPIANWNYLLDALSELFISNYIFLILIVFIMIFLIKGFRDKKFKDDDFRFKVFIVSSPLVCIAILYILGTLTNVFHERYLIYVTPYIVLSLFVFSENKVVFYFVSSVILLFEISGIEFNETRRMDYRFAAFLAKKLQTHEKTYILIQTHDVINLFTYYFDRKIFESKNRVSKPFLAERDIFDIENLENLKEIKFSENKPILFFQSYQNKEDAEKIDKYFEDQKYLKFTTNQIEGVKFTYLKKMTN